MASRGFKYVGDPNEENPHIPDRYEFFGYVFLKGRARAIQEPEIQEKLAGNSHFEEVNRSKKKE